MAHMPSTTAGANRCWNNSVARLCCMLCVFWAASAAFAQYRFISWTTENGLPNNWISAIHLTRDGYLWLTTRDGVARFDGVRFRVFNKTNTPNITSNRFAYRAMLEDSQGNLWMGTDDGGVILYHNGIFTPLTTQEGLPSNKIIRIDGDASGTIWIFTSAGVVRWRNGHLVLPRSKFDQSLDAWLTRPKNMTVDAPLFGLWRFTAGQWQRFAYGHWSPLPLPPDIHDPANVYFKAMAEDSDRRLWYSLRNRPHEYYSVIRGRLKQLRGVPNILATYICGQDREGRIWMGNHYGEVGLWQNGHFQHLSGITTPNVFQVMEDREGNLWIATLDRGLYHMEKQVITTYHRPGGVQANYIGPMLQDRTGAVWLGSGGLTRFEDGRFSTFYRPGQPHYSWSWANMFSALYQDRDGSLWVDMWDGSILRFKDGQFHSDKALSARVKDRLNVIVRDRAGDLWFGGDEGLYRVHDHRVTHFTARDGMPGNTVNIIEEDGDGKLWIGTSGGLVQYVSGKLVPVVGMQGVCVEALYQDKARVWWVGTLDDGLYRLASGPSGVKINRYTTAQGLYSNRADAVLEDKLGYLWMSCDLGLYRVRKQALNDLAAGRITQVISTRFGESDGLPDECTGGGQGMAFKAHDGRLWFATQNGVAVVDPWAVPVSRRPPPIRIEGCLIGMHPVACRPSLRLRPGYTDMEINYTALSFIKPEQIRFNYELQGLDRHWVEAGTRRTAYYPHLPPGKYLFRVIAANSDGVWNTKGQSLSVVVLPPFYRTWWFLALASLIVAGSVVLAWRYRVLQLKRAHELQVAFSRQLIASQEGERKRIAAELHDSIGQHLLIIKNWAMLALAVQRNHEPAVQEPLSKISATASKAVDEVRGIAYDLRPYQLEKLGLTTAIEDLVNQVAAASSIQLTAEVAPLNGLFSKETEISIYRIVQEGLNNIVRHSQATAARVAVERLAGVVELRIEDNGKGFTPTDGRTPEHGRNGFGLVGIAERVRMLGGQVTIQSAPGGGSAINISLKLQEAAR